MGVSAGNCAVFVANRIIIGAGADNLVLVGLLRRDGVWHHDRDARCAAPSSRYVKALFKSAAEGGQLCFSLPSFIFHKNIHGPYVC